MLTRIKSRRCLEDFANICYYHYQKEKLISNYILIYRDPKKDSEFRSTCCVTLATLTFFTNIDKESIRRSMDQLSNVFKKSCLKGDGTTPSLKPGDYIIHAAALSSWCLLATIASQSVITQALEDDCHLIVELLQSNDLHVSLFFLKFQLNYALKVF